MSVSVWVDGWGEVATHNPDLELVPASNQKLLVAIAANELLDLDAPLTTEIDQVGDDLVIRSSADPTLGFAELEIAIDEVLEENGSTTIDTLVVDVTEFPQETTADGWLDRHVPRFTGPLSGFMLENNRWTENEALVANPVWTNTRRLVEIIEGPGDIDIGSFEIVRGGAAPAAGETITAVDSPPIRTLVENMLVSSNNTHADMLMLEVGRAATGSGTLDDGAFAVETVLADLCAPVDGSIDDGSGLSRQNFRSARSFVDILVALHGTPDGELLRSQLPVGGVSGTLARRFSGPYAGRVQAKTGTLWTASALTGWAEMSSGRDAIFSVIINGDPEQPGPSPAAIDALVRVVLDS